MTSLLFYLSIFFAVFIFNYIGYIYYKKNRNKSKLFIYLGFVILVLVIGLRYEVGTDYNAYLSIYNNIKNISWNQIFQTKIEYGSFVIFKVTWLISKNQYTIFSVIGFLTLLPIYIANKEFDYKYLPYSILIFCMIYLPTCLNIMRQGIAIGFLCLSFVYIYKSKNRKAAIAAIIAILFHKSSFLLIPYEILYIFLKKKNYAKYSTILTLIISVIILFFFKELTGYMQLEEYNYVLKEINVERISYSSILFYLPILIIVCVFKQKEKLFATLKSLYIDGIILHIVGTAAIYFYRISFYFTIFQIFLIPISIYNIKKRNTRLLVKILCIIYLLIYFVSQYYIHGKSEIFPYKTWLFMQ